MAHKSEKDSIEKQFSGHVVVITDGTSEVGQELAFEMCERGAKVIILCRENFTPNSSLMDNKIEIENVDFSSLDSIREAAEAILAKEDKIDILINNSDIRNDERCLTKDGFESHFGCNYLAHFLLTELLMPLLERSAYCGNRPKILVITDVAFKKGQIQWSDVNFKDTKYTKKSAYGQSKLANLMHCIHLNEKLEESTITVVAVKPNTPKKSLFCGCFKETFSTTDNIIFCCLKDDLNGVYYENCKEVQVKFKEDDLKRLWLLSEHLLGWSSIEGTGYNDEM